MKKKITEYTKTRMKMAITFTWHNKILSWVMAVRIERERRI